jgi:hypothetical protein
MRIEYLHASKFGNEAAVADKFREQMAAKGVTVAVHHVRDPNPTELLEADRYSCRQSRWTLALAGLGMHG